MRTLKSPLLLAALCLTALANANRAAAAEPSSKEIYQKVLKSIALVSKGTPRGTAWLVDRVNRLMVTNYHVVDRNSVVEVTFPAYRNGTLIAEADYYLRHAQRYTARVVDISVKDDLAVLQLDSLPADVVEIRLAATSPSPAERVHSVGSPDASGALWVYTSGTVRAVYTKQWTAANGPGRTLRLDTKVVETQSPTNPGDSGGPLVNDRGELVGVTQGYSRAGHLVSWFIDVTRVRDTVATARRVLNPVTAEDYNQRGNRHTDRRQYTAAIADYTIAIQLKSNSAVYYRNRGSAFVNKGDYTTALADLQRALELKPDYDRAWFWKGVAHERRKEYDDAMTAYTRAIQLQPNYAQAYNNRGVVYSRRGQMEEALQDYSQAIRLDSKLSRAYSNRGLILASRNNHKAALLDYTSAIQNGGGDATVLNDRGNSFFALGMWEEAFKDYSAALDLAPRDAAIWVNAGATLFRKGEDDKAVKVYEKAIEMNPNYARSYFKRAEVFELRGLTEQASADYERAIRLDAKFANLAPVQDQRYLKLVNKSSETLTVSLRYEAKTKDGGWFWYRSAQGQNPVQFTLRPGQSALLLDEGWQVKARRVRIWAEGSDGGIWLRDRGQDIWLCRAPYRAQRIDVFTYSFTR